MCSPGWSDGPGDRRAHEAVPGLPALRGRRAAARGLAGARRQDGRAAAAGLRLDGRDQAMATPAMLVFADADSIRPEHIVEFFGLLGGGLATPGGTARGADRAAGDPPGTTHYDISAPGAGARGDPVPRRPARSGRTRRGRGTNERRRPLGTRLITPSAHAAAMPCVGGGKPVAGFSGRRGPAPGGTPARAASALRAGRADDVAGRRLARSARARSAARSRRPPSGPRRSGSRMSSARNCVRDELAPATVRVRPGRTRRSRPRAARRPAR